MAASRGPLLRHELRALGPVLFGIPIFVAALFAVAAGMMAFKQAQRADIGNMLTAGLESGLPLAVGIVFATVAAREPALEVQLTLTTPYRLTLLRRLTLLLLWAALIEGVAVLWLGSFDAWALHRGGLDAV